MKTIKDKMTIIDFQNYVKEFFHRILIVHEPKIELTFDEWIECLKNTEKAINE